jgi:hypothetical protein
MRWLHLLVILLCLADCLLTFLMLGDVSGVVYEANPIADMMIARFGRGAVFAWKLLTASVYFACVISLQYLKKPRVAFGTAVAASTLLGATVLYSLVLFVWLKIGE